MNNTAFVPAATWRVSQFVSRTHTSFSSFPTTKWTVSISHRSRLISMNADADTSSDATSSEPSTDVTDPTVNDESSTDTSEPTSEIPAEPYPGFFADMKRMGMSEEEAYAQALKASKQANPVKSEKVGGAKNLFKADGTPYAPWMANMSPEYNNAIIKKRTDATGRLAADPQSAELSGVGLQWKMLGDELELRWATGGEEGNVGFVIYRRKGKDEKWEKLADYRDAPAELASKGSEGGQYSFIVTDPKPGSWVYRVSDVDQNQNVADLAQLLVEVDSAEDQRIQKIALVVLLAILGIAVFAGLSLDPLSST